MSEREMLRQRRLQALGISEAPANNSASSHPPRTVSEPPNHSHSRPTHHSNPTNLSTTPTQPRYNNSNIHTLSSTRSSASSSAGTRLASNSSSSSAGTRLASNSSSSSSAGTRLASNSRTQVVTQSHELYVRLPSKSITSQQLEQYVKTQFGVDVVVRHMNTKHQGPYQLTERNFCFVSCDTREDMEHLIDGMNDSTIGDWEDPLMVKEKLDHPAGSK